MIDDLHVELPPARYMLVVRNDDVPGMIATVTSALARRRRSTSPTCTSATHSAGEAAMQVLADDEPVRR